MNTKHFILSIWLLLLCTITATAQKNTLAIPDMSVAPGKTISLPINLDNTADVVAVQFTLTVPDGITLDESSATMSERSDGHSVTMKQMSQNTYMTMVFSASNTAIVGRTGMLMSVNLSASSTLEEGSVLPFSLSDVVIADNEGNNLTTGYSAGKLTIAKTPDLEVSSVTATPTELMPNSMITVSWQVANIGGLSTEAGWSENVYLDSEDGTSKLLGTIYYEDKLLAGGMVSRSADFTLPQILELDGKTSVRVRLTANSDAGEPTGLQDNNTAQTEATYNVSKLLTLTPSVSHIEEEASGNVRFQLTRSGKTANAETFALTATADSRVTLPTSVTIEKGLSGVYFYAQVAANKLLDNDSIVDIAISGNGYGEVSSKIIIEDDTYPSLSITANAEDVTEGGNLVLTVTTERASNSDTEIKLACDHSSRFSIPSQITIPAGSTSIDVTVETVEDDTPSAEEVVTFTASAAKHNPATLNTVIVDNDVPTLTLELTPNAVSEGDGPLAVSAKLRRTDNIDKVVTVKFTDDSDGGVYYGQQSVEMASGVEEVLVNLGPIDNATVDGERTYNISAAVWIASCSCNASSGTSGGIVTVPLTVYDNDGPTLTLSSSASVLKEGGEMTVTVSRNTSTTEALTVSLSSEHDSQIEYPATVTIAAGKTSASFTVKSGSNDVSDDGFIATLTAAADGYAKSTTYFSVTDQTLPDAQITSIELSDTEKEVGDTVTVKLTMANTGSYELPELTKVSIHTGSNSTTAYLQSTLAAGETVEISKEITLPTSVGTYNVYAVVNEEQEAKELLYTNNTSNMLQVKAVSPFSVTVAADKATYKKGETVNITGRITGSNIANQSVEVYVINDGYRHTITAETDANGAFSTTYQPYDAQMGHFVLGACYPNEGAKEEMASFDFYGMKRTSNSAITCETLLGETYNGSFTISNPGNLSLSGITATVASKPDNCDVQITCPTSLNGGETATISYALLGSAISSGNDWEKIDLDIETAEGATLTTTLYYYCKCSTGKLQSSVARINTTMIKGTSRNYQFTISNIGKGETGKITVEIPSWMSYVTPKEMASLANGESSSIILRLKPTDDMQLNNPVTGTIGVNCDNGDGLSIPYSIEPVSVSTGKLIIDVCDENTYYTSEAPHLQGAKVVVTHPTTGEVKYSGETGADGTFTVDSIAEGYYTVSVTADSHSSYKNNILVDPGIDNTVVVNLSYESITVNWTVEETEVEDEYTITTTVEYETSVPTPAVVLSIPSEIAANELADGESLIFYATLTNKGLITAEDVELTLPTDLSSLTFEAMSNQEPFNLAAQQSVIIPVKVTKVSTSSAKSVVRRKGHIDNDPCRSQVGTLYFWDCGLDRKWHAYDVALQLGPCKSGDPSTWDNTGDGSTYGGGTGGGGLYGPGSSPNIGGSNVYTSETTQNPLTSTEDKGCEPCQNKFMLDMVDCGLQLIPEYKILKQVLACVTSVYGVVKIAQGKPTAAKLLGAALEATSSCVAAKGAGAGDKNQSRAKKREEAIEAIVTTLGSLVGKAGKEGVNSLDWDDAVETLGSLASSLSTLAGFDYDHLEEMFCPLKLLKPCDLDSVPQDSIDKKKIARNNVARAIKSDYPSYIKEYQKSIAYALVDQMALLSLKEEVFGDIVWQNSDEEQLQNFANLILESQNSLGVIENESVEKVVAARPENVSKEDAIKFIDRWNNSMQSSNSTDCVNTELLMNYFELIETVDSTIVSLGYSSIDECYEKEYEKFKEEAESNNNSVCSSISLQFSQSMVMTRQAFRGTLTVYNGNEETEMSDVKLTLTVTDEEGNAATSHEFQINMETLNGFAGELNFSDGWTLAAGETGTATVLFIPTKYAAPTENKKYLFGGSLSYIDPYTGLEVTRELSPVTLTVKPSPNLALTYFMQRDIIGDDPLTVDVVEPCEEAEFSLLINNTGYGDATNVKMTTEQPEIIDNEKGLAIEFELMSSQLNGGDATLALGGSVVTDFGTIPAKGTSYAQWWLKSSLLGHFTNYDVEATHVTSYGNEDLSLLDTVTIHELIRSLDVESGSTKMVGFMTNDIVDADDTPDMLYLSNGTTESVAVASTSSIKKTSETDYELTVTSSATGWNYGNLKDPTYGVSALKSVVRKSDGKEMSLRNFWQTDRTLRDGKDPLYENRIHFADDFAGQSEETYTLTFEPTPELLLEVAAIEGVPAEDCVAFQPIDTVKVVFNKPIDATTFTADDMTMRIQGEKQDASPIKITTEDNKTFTLDFTEFNETSGNGYHTLAVQTADVTDYEGYQGKNGKSVGWIMFRDGYVKLLTSAYPVNAGSVKRSTSNAAKAKRANAASEEDGDKAEYGSMVTLFAEPSKGYEFSNWTLNGEEVSTSPTYECTALGDMDVVANFTKKNYEVTVAGDNEEGGTVEGNATGIYQYGEKLSFIANPGDDYIFGEWNVGGKSLGDADTLTVTVDSAMTVTAKFVRDIYEQRLKLSEGWNWISTYLQEPLSIYEFTDRASRILGQDDGVIYDSESGAINEADTIAPGLAYKVEAFATFLKSFEGRLYNVTETPMSLTKGWNWIAYPYFESRNIADVITNAEEGDYLTAQTGFTAYADGNWEGTLDTLTPGYGYLYKSSSDKSLAFNFSATSADDPKTTETPSENIELDIRKYPNTMNVIARLYLSGTELTGDAYSISAMSGNEVRGMGALVNDNYYITVYGDEATDISFVVEDNATGNTYIATGTVEFRNDVVGSRKSPYAMNLDEATSVESLLSESGHKLHIHSIQGFLIKADATLADIKKLSKGIYIIDGRKYVVK